MQSEQRGVNIYLVLQGLSQVKVHFTFVLGECVTFMKPFSNKAYGHRNLQAYIN